MRTSGLKALLAVLLASSVAASDTTLLDRVEGYYVALARNCTYNDDDDGVERGCIPARKDCLLVQKTDQDHAVISLYSQQRLGNNCGVSGPVTVKGNSLIFPEHDPRDVISFGQGFVINFSHGLVTFKYRPAPQVGLPPFCGSLGNLELVKFRMTDRVPVGNHKC